MICRLESYIFVEKILLNKTIKTVTLLSAYKKVWIAFRAVNITLYYYINWLLHTTNIFYEKKYKKL